MPVIFVLLWSTSFVGARYGLPYAEPLTFVGLRLFLAAAILTPAVLVLRAPWPGSWRQLMHIVVAGLLMNVFGLGGMFSAMATGMPLALVALIAALQPLLTGLLANITIGEKVTARQWLGFILGLGGVFLLLLDKLHGGNVSAMSLAAAGVGLLGFTFGTLYQKAFCAHMDLRSGPAIQLLVSAPVVGLLAILLETQQIRWAPEFILALLWLVIAVSIGAMMVLWYLVRHGAVTKVASLFYLIAPVTAVLAFLAFGEQISVWAALGIALTSLGVAFVTAARG